MMPAPMPRPISTIHRLAQPGATIRPIIATQDAPAAPAATARWSFILRTAGARNSAGPADISCSRPCSEPACSAV